MYEETTIQHVSDVLRAASLFIVSIIRRAHAGAKCKSMCGANRLKTCDNHLHAKSGPKVREVRLRLVTW